LEATADPRLTQTGEWLGTVDFMAPEQFRDDEIDARTDVYALGCVLHTALTGRPPFHRGTIAATMLAHLDDPTPRPSETADVPAALDAVVARALAKHPEERYRSAGELANAALAAIGQPVLAARSAGRSRPKGASDRAPTVVLPDPTRTLENGAGATARIVRSRPRLGRPALLATGLAVAAGATLAVIAVDPFGADERGPLSESEVRGVVDAFADAYAREAGADLGRVLARDVARVTPGDTQRGRGVVVREYRRQFAAQETGGYALRELEVRPGAIGRASARYVVSRSGGSPITGRVVFGVERDQGEPRIGLIAATPDA
ncbi:MAG TPA: protein kinase, partial [Thermoleophilaceae bacterium]|nr:protein kinase [Thermoleophilaceae bacterium]